jgi:hypothetical protein
VAKVLYGLRGLDRATRGTPHGTMAAVNRAVPVGTRALRAEPVLSTVAVDCIRAC